MTTTDNIQKEEKKELAGSPLTGMIVWGAKGAGKTLFGLNSPFQPVHVLDTEFSSKEYFMHQGQLIKMGIIPAEFTRDDVYDLNSFGVAVRALAAKGHKLGTLIIDTAGQWGDWTSKEKFGKAISDKISQIVWGDIRSELRRQMIYLSSLCDLLIITAHERKYGNNLSPRCNPAFLEIASTSIRLVRDPNKRIPSGQIIANRLPFFPPNIPDITIQKMLDYIPAPVEKWDDLPQENKIPDEPVVNEEIEE